MRALSQLIEINIRAWRERDDGASKSKSVSGPDHRAQSLLALLRIAQHLSGKRADPAPFREAQRRRHRFSVGVLPRFGAIVLLDPCGAELFEHAPLAVAAAGQRLRLGQRICRVIDVPLLGKALGDPREIGSRAPSQPRSRIFRDR